MKRLNYFAYIYVSIAGLFVCSVNAQTVYRTEVLTNQIKSLQVKVAGELISEPFIELGGERAIEINFDALNHSQGRFAYSVVHCDADWRQSSLFPIEYMDGFQGLPIEDYAQAMNTTTHYTNYRLYLPNDNVRFKASGNYAVQVYDEDNPERILFTACFGVYEPLVGIQAQVSTNTDISFNKAHQQVSFMIDNKNLNVRYPQNDLKVFVMQNNRMDNATSGLQPSSIADKRQRYEHLPSLIFEAGNEYRRIEFLTHRYNGMGIAHVAFFNPYYHADVQPESSRARTGYLYDQDQNGRFFINCSGCQDPDTEADYFIVHFTCVSERLDGEVYLLGDIFQNRLCEESRMDYNEAAGQYEKVVLLKQGLYNYLYVCLPPGETKALTLPLEGDFFQTENEYTILVYYHPIEARYDRLVGKLRVRGEGDN